MVELKEIRKRAWQSLKGHYWIFVAACLLAAILGTEYANTLHLLRIQKRVEERGGDMEPALGVGGAYGEISVLNDLINGNLDGAMDSVRHRIDMYQGRDTHIGKVELGHSRGVLASVVNQIASGTLLLRILTLLDTILSSKKLSVILLAFLGFSLSVLFWLFISNVYRVAYCRVFLEGRLYAKIPFSRFVFLYRIKKHVKASLSMAVYMLLNYLWLFTIVMFPVKRYAYLLAPYLVAENPDLSPLEAVRLSQRMMKGHKWEAFLMELSLLPWTLLSIVTGGMVGILFSNPYREAAFAEYYACIRKEYLEKQAEGTERLNDLYLFEAAAPGVLHSAYADIAEISEGFREMPQPRPGVWGFLEKYFGIVLSYDEREQQYRDRAMLEQQTAEYREALAGRTYPTRLFPIAESHKRRKTEEGEFLRHYSIPSLILLFFAGCAVGWIWEVALHMLQTGEFANRGVLHGPWLPIYGGGAVLALVVLYYYRKQVFKEFLLIVLLCGFVEYFTSWLLEILHDGQKWWNYSGYYLNLNGRICAEGLLVFGIAGTAFIYVLAPMLDDLFERIRPKILWPLCIALLLVFFADVIYSSFVPNTGKGVTSAAVVTVQEETETEGEGTI